MTDNEIIKELNLRIDSFSRETLDLINRQKDKIKEFDEKLIIQQGLIDYQKAEINKLKQENDFFRKTITENAQRALEVTVEEIEKAKSEAIKGVTKKIDELLKRYSHIHEDAEIAIQDEIECDNETIEMQSVWDVHTLMRYEMASEPEEMNRLQDNIETIAKERLLKEIEKDFRLLVKEMTEVEENDK